MTRFIQAQAPPPSRSPALGAVGRIQRYSAKQLETATSTLKLPLAKVQGLLEIGEATGLFAEVYEVATSKFLLNPEGFATMLGSFKAIIPKKAQAQALLTTEPSMQPATTSGGASGFVRELLYGLQHIRKEFHVQYGAMAPDDLADALASRGLNDEAIRVRKESSAVSLGDHLGGDVVVWGRKSKSDTLGETVQHKVVEGKDDFAVANELRNAIHQLAGRNKELAIQGTQRTADIVIMPGNTMAAAESAKLIDLIKGRMKDAFQGKPLSTYVDVVRITTGACQVEYDARTDAPTVVVFGSEASDRSPQHELSVKTPAKWNAEAISRPIEAQAEPEVAVAPEKKMEERSPDEVMGLIGQIEKKPGKPIEVMSKSALSTVLRELEDARKQWLAVKAAPSLNRKNELTAARDSWISERLSKISPPPERKELGNERTRLKALWEGEHKSEAEEIIEKQALADQIGKRIQSDGGKDAEVLAKFDTTMAICAKQIDLLASYDAAAHERNTWVRDELQRTGEGQKTKEELEKLWDAHNPTKVPLVAKNAEYAKINEESIRRDKELKKERDEQRKKDEAQVGQVCQPLFKAVEVLKKSALKDLMDSMIAVLQQARHSAAIGTLCEQLADQLLWADKLSASEALERKGLVGFTENLCKHKDYNNLQGDLSEITDAVRMAMQPAEQRSGPVVIGTTNLDLDKSQKQPQEVDVSFESSGKGVLHLHEVAWDIKTLESKLLGTDKQSQREGYARVIKAQREGATGREVRMTYVVHKSSADDQQAIGSNVAPSADKLGSDVSGEVTASEPGAMAKILSKRGYFLSLGGKVFTPDEIRGWIAQ